ncbi:MAG TPA: hypothetical protein VGJ45_07870 [Pseudonocardiaceae bacterium]|jgi:hypothetical protein
MKKFGASLYEFVVGDDWRIAVAVVLALAITVGIARTAIPAWWVLPAAVVLILPVSLAIAVRRR